MSELSKPQRLLIAGTGSHARKVAGCAAALGWSLAGFVDEAAGAQAPIAQAAVIAIHALGTPGGIADVLFVAIGDPVARARLCNTFKAQGWQLARLVHPRAWVADDVVLGEGVLVAAGAVIETGAVIGRGAIIDIGALVDHDARIGEFSHLRPGGIIGPRASFPGDSNN